MEKTTEIQARRTPRRDQFFAYAACMGFFATMLASFAGVPRAHAQSATIRVGHFPNITHVQALVARNLERQGREWFAARVGSGVKIEWYAYNAGPSAMEAIFANALDVTYVGPNPAINAYARSGGKEIRIVAGAVNGGSALVVQPELRSRKTFGFPRQTHCDAPVREHARRGGARLAHGRRPADHANRRRRASVADRKSRSAAVVPTKACRRGLDGRTLGIPARAGSRRQDPG